MDVRLLRQYRRMAREKFFLIEERAEYPRCRYRWAHDKEELKPRYFLCDTGAKMWNEKQGCYQATRNFDEAQKVLQLIELGFEKPKGLTEADPSSGKWVREAYSIGELIEMLPISFETANGDTSWLEIEAGAVWSISYSSFGFIDYDCERKELIDALFDMILQLKEEEII